jgi:hypothetical protein|tara:strand:+ start:217 stop:897 length:681 start_codon:yes stop_codon:yes gene_type:complete
MADKKFNRKFMHPTRRKLADMVRTGEYEKNTQIGFSDIKETKTKRKVGDIWSDSDGNVWEQKDFGKVKSSKMSNVLSELRKHIEEAHQCKSDECDVSGKFSKSDKTLISKTGYCAGCLARRELVIKQDGLWKEYEEYRIYSNMAAYGTDVLEKWNQALKEVSNIHEYVNDDGSVEQWQSNDDVQTLKAQIEADIDNGKKELTDVIEKRNIAYEKLKDKNYELVKQI